MNAAHTQTLGISVDSHFTHGAWGEALGGIGYPLLSDFNPKGAVAASFGLYLEAAGITDRATVLIDAGGTIRHLSSVSPSGKRDMGELVAMCEALDADWDASLPDIEHAPGTPNDAILYVRNNCMFSKWALSARTNLKLVDSLPIRNVSVDAAAKSDLLALSGKAQAPALHVGGDVLFESKEIIAWLAERANPL